MQLNLFIHCASSELFAMYVSKGTTGKKKRAVIWDHGMIEIRLDSLALFRQSQYKHVGEAFPRADTLQRPTTINRAFVCNDKCCTHGEIGCIWEAGHLSLSTTFVMAAKHCIQGTRGQGFRMCSVGATWATQSHASPQAKHSGCYILNICLGLLSEQHPISGHT